MGKKNEENREKKKFFSFKGKKYALKLDALKNVCLTSVSEGDTRQNEISEVHERTEEGDFVLASKVVHEIKSKGDAQNNMIIYDVVKNLILALLEVTATEAEFEPTFATILAINTLLSWGILVEIE